KPVIALAPPWCLAVTSAAPARRSRSLLVYLARTSRSAAQHESTLARSPSSRHRHSTPAPDLWIRRTCCPVLLNQGIVLAARSHSDGPAGPPKPNAIAHSSVFPGRTTLASFNRHRSAASPARPTSPLLEFPPRRWATAAPPRRAKTMGR